MYIKKRGQITYFIIVGIIILLTIGSVLFYKHQNTDLQLGLKEPVEKVPAEIQPLMTFASNCLDTVTKEALVIVGMQGGYIDPESFSIITIADEPTRSDALDFRDGSFKIPYWWHLDSSNNCNGNCVFESERPPLGKSAGEKSIEIQVMRYIGTKFPLCLAGFSSFKNAGYKVTNGTMTIETSIAADDFQVLVTYPLTIEKGEVKHTINQFYTKQDVNLRKIYELATLITASEYTYNYIEKETANIIAAYGGIDKDKLPPMYETSFSPRSPVYWVRSEVEKDAMGLIGSHVPLFQIPGTANYQSRENLPDDEYGIYKLFDLPLRSLQGYSYQDVSVSFRYHNWWKPFFDIRGRGVSGELIGPEQGFMALLSFMGFQRYNNYYDISYPVMVELYDKDAYGGTGYTFNVALESNLRNNKPMTVKFQELGAVISGEDSLLCNANQRNSGEYTIIAKDAVTNKQVPGVLVSYSCGEESCVVGHTVSSQGGISIKDKLPVCVGGMMTFYKVGYETKTVPVTTLLEKGGKVEVSLEPEVTLDLKVMKKRFSKTLNGWQFNPVPVNLQDNEYAIVMLTRVDGDEYEAASVYRGNETSTIKLLPGKYRAEITLMYELPYLGRNSIVIPAKKEKQGPIWDETTVELPQIEFNTTFVEGGAVFDQESGYLVVERPDLTGANSVNFFAIAAISSNNFDQLEHSDIDRLDLVDENSKIYRSDLEPAYSKGK